MNEENLVFALQQVLEANQEEKEARKSYHGVEWGYHGFHFQEKVKKANEEFMSALNSVIDSRVKAILENNS